MNAVMQLELSDRQREILLRGLRFVRSSRMLEFRDSSEVTEDERRVELEQIHELSNLLQAKRSAGQTAGA